MAAGLVAAAFVVVFFLAVAAVTPFLIVLITVFLGAGSALTARPLLMPVAADVAVAAALELLTLRRGLPLAAVVVAVDVAGRLPLLAAEVVLVVAELATEEVVTFLVMVGGGMAARTTRDRAAEVTVAAVPVLIFEASVVAGVVAGFKGDAGRERRCFAGDAGRSLGTRVFDVVGDRT